jgi:hypothetical protein
VLLCLRKGNVYSLDGSFYNSQALNQRGLLPTSPRIAA